MVRLINPSDAKCIDQLLLLGSCDTDLSGKDKETLKLLIGAKWAEQADYAVNLKATALDLYHDPTSFFQKLISYVVIQPIGCIGFIFQETSFCIFQSQPESYSFQPRNREILKDLFAAASTHGLITETASRRTIERIFPPDKYGPPETYGDGRIECDDLALLKFYVRDRIEETKTAGKYLELKHQKQLKRLINTVRAAHKKNYLDGH